MHKSEPSDPMLITSHDRRFSRRAMVKVYKPGKVAIITQGRYAGRKVVLVKHYDDGSRDRPYGHALVAGIDRYPRKITSTMSQRLIRRRSSLKPFIKVVNYNHLLPTRYTLDLEGLKSAVTMEGVKDKGQRKSVKKDVKKIFGERYKTGKNRWFFTKLRF